MGGGGRRQRVGEGRGRQQRKSVLEVVVPDLGGPLAAFRFCRVSPGGPGGPGLFLGFHLHPFDSKGCPRLDGAPVRVLEAVGCLSAVLLGGEARRAGSQVEELPSVLQGTAGK